MSENKAFITTSGEQGALHIADDVVASIAALAAIEVEGVAALSRNADRTELIGTKRPLSRGVKVRADGARITVDVFALAKYGFPVNALGRKIQEAVKSAVESMAGLEVAKINVHIAGIVLEQSKK